MNLKLNKPLVATVSLCLMLAASTGVAQDIDFSQAEDGGNQLIGFLRGPAATIVLVLAFAVTGFLAAFNRISWAWVGGVALGGLLIFGGPTFVDGFRAIFS